MFKQNFDKQNNSFIMTKNSKGHNMGLEEVYLLIYSVATSFTKLKWLVVFFFHDEIWMWKIRNIIIHIPNVRYDR